VGKLAPNTFHEAPLSEEAKTPISVAMYKFPKVSISISLTGTSGKLFEMSSQVPPPFPLKKTCPSFVPYL
jgi:hypothetical protein